MVIKSWNGVKVRLLLSGCSYKCLLKEQASTFQVGMKTQDLLYTFITMQFKTDIFLLIFNQKCCFFKDFSYKVFLREVIPFRFATSSSVNILIGGRLGNTLKSCFPMSLIEIRVS